MDLCIWHTARLSLRAPDPDDLGALFAIHSDPQTNRYNPAGPMQSSEQARQTLQDWQAHWQQYGFGYWAVERQVEPGQVIGFGGLRWRTLEGEQRLNLYFRFSPPAWGQGYAGELGRAALELAWNDLEQATIYATTRPDNLASIRVLERLGLQPVKTLPDDYGASLLFRIEK